MGDQAGLQTARFIDDGRTLSGFLGRVLAVCPRCSSCADVRPLTGEPGEISSAAAGLHPWSSPRKLVCVQCGLVKEQSEPGVVLGGPIDPYLRLPLFLTTLARGRTLWAYNMDHLDVLTRYVGAAIRQRPPGNSSRPMSMVEKLPPWMSAAGNRHWVLRGLEQLRSRLG